FKVAQLSSGGQAVALMMGGEEVPGTTTDPRQKRLLNVVEEMALAAGVPVPPVYVLKEPGINAFAAGYAPGDAAGAASTGGLNYWTRDELQGVVAHEFSHILNGDMRLNIRLIGLIFGIMALSIIGRILMLTSGGRSSGRGDSRGGLVLLGLGVFVLGLVGAFFGRLIMAAVSRQREDLADASAVQFTRNPDGIGGGLKKNRRPAQGARHRQPPAPQGRHHFFAHPPPRQGAPGPPGPAPPPCAAPTGGLSPRCAGASRGARASGVDGKKLQAPRPGRVPPFAGMPRLPGLPQVPMPVLGFADEAASRVGHVDPEIISYAQALHDGMPDVLRVAAQEPFSARALVYALLLDPRADLRDLPLTRLKAGAEAQAFAETLRLVAPVQATPDTHRLPLLDLAMPALRQMSPRQHRAFRAQVEVLMIADQRLSL